MLRLFLHSDIVQHNVCYLFLGKKLPVSTTASCSPHYYLIRFFPALNYLTHTRTHHLPVLRLFRTLSFALRNKQVASSFFLSSFLLFFIPLSLLLSFFLLWRSLLELRKRRRSHLVKGFRFLFLIPKHLCGIRLLQAKKLWFGQERSFWDNALQIVITGFSAKKAIPS